MPIKIGILSRNQREYKQRLLAELSQQPTEISSNIFASSNPKDFVNSDIDVLLANPNLAAEVVNSLSNLKWIQSTWAGVNSLIFQDKKNYQLTGLKNIFGQKMSEYVFGYLLYLNRDIEAYNTFQVNKQWAALPGRSLKGQVIGIMGMGNIGEHIAKHAKLFGMRVIALSRSSRSALADQHYAMPQISEFIRQCDVIVNVLPETPDTIGLCDRDFFMGMKRTGVFINVGRGSIIKDELVLDKILTSGHLSAAVIDVCQQEPLPSSHPFWTNNKVFLTNHTAAVSDIDDVYSVFWANLKHYVDKTPMSGQIDFAKGY